jgi:hypothetical protein
MRKWLGRSNPLTHPRLREISQGPARARQGHGPKGRLHVEALEDRLAPASLTDQAGVLTIHLDSPGENLTLRSTGLHTYGLASSTGTLFNAGLTGATYFGSGSSGVLALTSDTSVQIDDVTTGTSVAFIDSGPNLYAEPISVSLTNPHSGGVTFNGHSTFASGLTVQAARGDVVSNPGSTLTLMSSQSLTLQAGGNINLQGSVSVTGPGTTTLQADGSITANNAANAFGDSLTLMASTGTSAASASVRSAGALALAEVAVTGNLTVTAGGALTQVSNVTVGGDASFTTTAGDIQIDDFSNSIDGTISATVSGASNVTLGNNNAAGTLELGTVSMGSGDLILDNFATSFPGPAAVVSEVGAITTAGGVTIDVSAFNANVLLATAANSIGGLVMVNGFGSGDFALRNTAAGATPANVVISGVFVNNLTLLFDNAPSLDVSTLPAFTNDLTVRALGDIKQPAGSLSVGGKASFTSTGGSITLDNSANTFGGAISASVTGANDITLATSGGPFGGTITLGTITLGTGNLQVEDTSTSGFSTITEDPAGGITMSGAGATATFNIVNDTLANVDLSKAANDFARSVSVVVNGVAPLSGGPTSGNFGFRNTNPSSFLGKVTLNNYSVRDLTVSYDAAGVSIDAGTIPASMPFTGSLAVTAGGDITQSVPLTINGNLFETAGGTISQAAPLTVSGNATFTSTNRRVINTISLTDPHNSVGGIVSFNTPQGGAGAVSFVNSGAVTLGSCTLLTAVPFSVTALTGDITENSGATIAQVRGAGPATFTATAGTTIDLSAGFQNVFTGPVVFAGANLASAHLEDFNVLHNLGSVSVPGGAAFQSLSVTFDNPGASIVLPGASLPYSLTVTEENDVVLPSASTLNVNGDLSLTSVAGSVRLFGPVHVTGTTSLTVMGPVAVSITASNAGNNFGSRLALTDEASTSSSIAIVSAGALVLDNSFTAGGTLAATALAGSITQAAGTILDLGGASSFTTSSGPIALDQPGNVFGGAVSASVNPAGGDAVTIGGSGTFGDLTLGTVVLGTGTLTVVNPSASAGAGIGEDPTGGISTAATSTATLGFTVSAGAADVLLDAGANNLPAAVHVAVSGAGTTGDIGFRNVNPAASLAQLAVSGFTVENETVRFDKTFISLTSPVSVGGTLSLTAAGPISQAAGADVTAAGGVFTVLGNAGITLNNPGNDVSGTVGFFNPRGDNQAAVAFTNNGTIHLGSSSLGLGTFTLTASNAGDVVQDPATAVTQALGGGAVTLNAAGTAIDLSAGVANDLSGPVTFNDTSGTLQTVGLENADRLAALPTLIGAAVPMTSVTINFDNAPVALAGFDTASLSVRAGGNITQTARLTVSGHASFAAGPFGIQLTNGGNNFNVVTLSNSGLSPVALVTFGGLVIDDWYVGSGTLSVTANGPILETGGAVGLQQQSSGGAAVGLARFLAGNNPILLDNAANLLRGPVSLATTSAGFGTPNVTLVNAGDLTLGDSTVDGALSLTVAGGSGGLFQAPGTSFIVTGNAYFATGQGSINLTNAGNRIDGTISINTGVGSSFGGGLAMLSVTGPAQLADSRVPNPLTVTAGGAITQASGALHLGGGFFTAGGDITLTSAVNDFGHESLSLVSTGTVTVTDSNPSGVLLGQVGFGSGGLNLVAAGNVTQGFGQTGIAGPGLVSISNSSSDLSKAIDVILNHGDENAVGGDGTFTTFTLSNVRNVTIKNQGDIDIQLVGFIPANGAWTLAATGFVTLPTDFKDPLTLGSLTVSAHLSFVPGNLTTTTGGICITGAVNLATGRVSSRVTLDVSATSAGFVSFFGDVMAELATINLPAGGAVNFAGGIWDSSSLVINGSDAQLNINGGTFRMSDGGSVSLSGTPAAGGAPSAGNAINVGPGATFEAGNVVSVEDGGTGSAIAVNFDHSTLLVNLLSAPCLVLNGLNAADRINLDGALISSFSGQAPAGDTTVLSALNGAAIAGTFANPQDAAGNFLMGTDIVQATYDSAGHSFVTVRPGGAVAAGGVATGTEPDGDVFKVTVTGGSGLVVIRTGSGPASAVDVVVRNGSAATTVTITSTRNGGDGLISVGGIVVDGGGAAIDAPTSDVTGDISVAGLLRSLSLHNWSGGTLTATGTASAATTISGNVFLDDTITLGSQLGRLTVAMFGTSTPTSTPGTITAASFGTITATGNALANVRGDFDANLVNTNFLGATALTQATVLGTLSGNWDLTGDVGAIVVSVVRGVIHRVPVGVTAAATSNWNLGLVNGPGVVNAGLLGNVTLLNLGTARAVTMNAAGVVSTLRAISLNDWDGISGDPVAGVLQARAFGSVAITGSAAANDHGNLIANLTATGNLGGTGLVALGALSVAGDFGTADAASNATLTILNGDVETISVGRTVERADVNATSAAGSGAIARITAGKWDESELNARSVGTLRVVGNLPAGLFGDFQGFVTLTGTAGSTAATLGAFSASGDMPFGDFTIVNGAVGTFTVAGEMEDSSIELESAVGGNLGTISVGNWRFTDLTARTIGTLRVTSRAATAARTEPLPGDLEDGTVVAFEPAGLPTPGIVTFFVAGSLSSSGNYVLADNGITSFTVGRSVTATQVSTILNGGAGRIGALTAGKWDTSNLAAGSLGVVRITGYRTPELPGGFVAGDFTASDVIVTGAGGSPARGIVSMAVGHDLTDSFFSVPGGVGALSVAGQLSDTQLHLRNLQTPALGALGSLTAGQVQLATLDANTAGTLKTTGSLPLGLNGDVNALDLALSGFMGLPSAPVGLATLAVAGNLTSSILNVKDGVTTFAVAQRVSGSTVGAAYDPTNTGATLKTLTVGKWEGTTLSANSVGAFSVTGNAARGLSGDLIGSNVTVLRSLAGVGLGTFTASGRVLNSAIQVTSGNVTSFTAGSFRGSTLYVGYRATDPSAITDAANNQTAANWEGTFTLGSFKTTAVFNPSDDVDSAGFQAAGVVADRLGAVTVSGLNQHPVGDVQTFGVGFRATGGAAGTLTVTSNPPNPKTPPTTLGAFHYFGLGG